MTCRPRLECPFEYTPACPPGRLTRPGGPASMLRAHLLLIGAFVPARPRPHRSFSRRRQAAGRSRISRAFSSKNASMRQSLSEPSQRAGRGALRLHDARRQAHPTCDLGRRSPWPIDPADDARRHCSTPAPASSCLQSYLLVHDDWMDQDDERRGGTTLHKLFADRTARSRTSARASRCSPATSATPSPSSSSRAAPHGLETQRSRRSRCSGRCSATSSTGRRST